MLMLFQFAPAINVPDLRPCWLKAEATLRISRSASAACFDGTHAPAFRVLANGKRLRARFWS